MQTQDDDFPFTSDDPSLAPIELNNTILSLSPQQLGDLKATLRLIVGSALNGKDAYIQRLRQVQAAQEPVTPETIVLDANETFRDQIRYLLLGALFETPDILQRSLVAVEQGSSKVYGVLSKMLSPLTNQWVFSPVKNRFDYAASRGEDVIDRLIMKGRVEERNISLIIQQKALDDLVNEFLEYLVLKTEVKQLILEEGVTITGDAVDEFREQSATVDTKLEQTLKSVFRRRVPPQSDTPPGTPEERG